MSLLILVIDTSGSMDQSPAPGSPTYLQTAREVIASTLASCKGEAEVRVYTLGSPPPLLGSFSRLSGARRGIANDELFMRSGDSAAWDTIQELGAGLGPDEPAEIFCVMDGGDMSRRTTYDGLCAWLSKDRQHVHLTVVDVTGGFARKMRVLSGRESNVAVVDLSADPAGMGKALDKGINRIASKHPASLRITTPITALTTVSPEEIRAVREAIQRAISYLEDLTGLRYYPVPTILVSTDQMEHIHRPRTSPASPALPPGLDDVEEVLNVVNNLVLLFHTSDFEPKEVAENSRVRFRHLEYLRGRSEGLGGSLTMYALGEAVSFEVPGLTTGRSFIEGARIALRAIVEALRELGEIYPTGAIPPGGYYRLFLRPREARPVLSWDDPARAYRLTDESSVPAWERLVPNSLRPRLNRCQEGGQWRLDLPSVAEILDLGAEILLPLLSRIRASRVDGGVDVSILRAAGLYIPQGSTSQDSVQHVADSAGFPSFARLSGAGGIVMVDIERLRKGGHLCGTNDVTWPLLSLLIHEHSHAIYEEGVSKQASDYDGIPVRPATGLVHEAMAEWAELNYFRDNEAAVELSLHHASLGEWPAWPYAGVQLVEQRFDKGGLRAYRGILRALRSDPDSALSLLSRN